jgi:hypothetical protein
MRRRNGPLSVANQDVATGLLLRHSRETFGAAAAAAAFSAGLFFATTKPLRYSTSPNLLKPDGFETSFRELHASR